MGDNRPQCCVRKYTMCTSINKITPWIFGGQNWKHGRMVHSGGVYRGSVRRIVASRENVHAHMFALPLQSVIRCCRVSGCLQWLQRFVSLSRILVSRPFVGMILCPQISKLCRLCHTFDEVVDGCSNMARTSRARFAASVMVCRAIYSLLRNALGASFVAGGVI